MGRRGLVDGRVRRAGRWARRVQRGQRAGDVDATALEAEVAQQAGEPVDELLPLQEHRNDDALAPEHQARLAEQPVVESFDHEPGPRAQVDERFLLP